MGRCHNLILRMIKLDKKVEYLSTRFAKYELGEEVANPLMACNVITTYKEVQPLQELEGEIYKEEGSPGKFNFQREPHGLSLLRDRWYPRMIIL